MFGLRSPVNVASPKLAAANANYLAAITAARLGPAWCSGCKIFLLSHGRRFVIICLINGSTLNFLFILQLLLFSLVCDL